MVFLNIKLDVNLLNGLNSNIFTNDYHNKLMEVGSTGRYMGTSKEYSEYVEANFLK